MIKLDTLENQVNTVYLAIGSNLGNKKLNIEKAKYYLLQNHLKLVSISNYYKTPSWPNNKNPSFINIVLKAETTLYPLALLDFCKNIEKKLGRKKALINEPRICDIDILDYKGKIYKLDANNNKLIIPHPRLHDRNFVLFPLFEIQKNWKHPIKKTKIKDLIKKLDDSALYSINKI